MRVKNVKLVWNVLFKDFNTGTIGKYNIFYDGFIDELHKSIKSKKVNNYAELREYINRWAMYNYWSKTECEICVGRLCDKYPDEYEKTDIYFQIEMNLDHIVDYIIEALKIDF